jgi:hypothetical protein
MMLRQTHVKGPVSLGSTSSARTRRIVAEGADLVRRVCQGIGETGFTATRRVSVRCERMLLRKLSTTRTHTHDWRSPDDLSGQLSAYLATGNPVLGPTFCWLRDVRLRS